MVRVWMYPTHVASRSLLAEYGPCVSIAVPRSAKSGSELRRDPLKNGVIVLRLGPPLSDRQLSNLIEILDYRPGRTIAPFLSGEGWTSWKLVSVRRFARAHMQTGATRG